MCSAKSRHFVVLGLGGLRSGAGAGSVVLVLSMSGSSQAPVGAVLGAGAGPQVLRMNHSRFPNLTVLEEHCRQGLADTGTG